MSKIEKLILRLKGRPKDFTYDELVKVLASFGFVELPPGKTGGSRRAFFNEQSKAIIRLHKPHPSNILKLYQIDEVLSVIEKMGK